MALLFIAHVGGTSMESTVLVIWAVGIPEHGRGCGCDCWFLLYLPACHPWVNACGAKVKDKTWDSGHQDCRSQSHVGLLQRDSR